MADKNHDFKDPPDRGEFKLEVNTQLVVTMQYFLRFLRLAVNRWNQQMLKSTDPLVGNAECLTVT